MNQEQYIQTLSTATPDTSTASLLTNAGGALALVLLLIMAVAWVARRAGLTSGLVKSGKHLSIVESRSLGQRERAVIIEVENKWLVLGVTSSQVSCLASLDKPLRDEGESDLEKKDEFQTTLMKILKKNKVESVK